MWIKVCGIRDSQTARQVAELDINAVGLNFFARSPRFVSADDAKQISEIIPSKIARVGLFVNHPISQVEVLANECGLDMIQLHGDESVDDLKELQQRLPRMRFIRAWRMSHTGLGELASFLQECSRRNLELAGCLVDAHVAGMFGGSGKTVDWDLLNNEYDREAWPPLILAGGLVPANIANAILATKPWGVDVASGVESSPGIKDIELVRQFVENARGVGL